MRIPTAICLFLITATVATAQPNLVAHEWGAISTVQSANGKTRGGMEVNLRELPPFVLRWSTVPMLARVHVIEKPILYLYVKQQMKVSVKASIPSGMWTEWWPPAQEFAPRIQGGKDIDPKNGWLKWTNLIVTPDAPAKPSPQTAPAASWYPILRDTDASWIRVRGEHYRSTKGLQTAFDEVERFLLYRGMADRREAVTLRVANTEAGAISLTNTGKSALGKAIIVRISGSSGWWVTVDAPRPGQTTTLPAAKRDAIPVATIKTQGSKAIAKLLTDAGMFDKEARGFARIWGAEWLTAPGLRVLHLVPTAEIDRLMPLDIKPAPSKTVRVLMSRIESLTPERVAQIQALVHKLGARTWKDRDRAARALAKLGRIAEPVLREALEATEDLETRSRIENLLKLLQPTNRQTR